MKNVISPKTAKPYWIMYKVHQKNKQTNQKAFELNQQFVQADLVQKLTEAHFLLCNSCQGIYIMATELLVTF